MSEIKIRKGTPADLPQVLDLIIELAIYEKAPNEVTNTVEQMMEDGFGPNPVYGLTVAEADQEIIGISIFYDRYSTWKGRMLYLEDIVVRESWRGKGIGHQLFQATMKIALDENYKGMVWQVLDWNEPAIRFYKKYDANLDPEWINGKLTRNQLEAYFN